MPCHAMQCCRGKLTVHLPEVRFRVYPKGVDRVFELKGPYDEVQLWVAALKSVLTDVVCVCNLLLWAH